MSTTCSYHGIIKGTYENCLAFYYALPKLDEKYIIAKDQNGTNSKIEFAGDCSSNLDWSTKPWDNHIDIRVPNNEPDIENYINANGLIWYTLDSKCKMFNVEIWCESHFNDCTSNNEYTHINSNGMATETVFPEEIVNRDFDDMLLDEDSLKFRLLRFFESIDTTLAEGHQEAINDKINFKIPKECWESFTTDSNITLMTKYDDYYEGIYTEDGDVSFIPFYVRLQNINQVIHEDTVDMLLEKFRTKDGVETVLADLLETNSPAWGGFYEDEETHYIKGEDSITAYKRGYAEAGYMILLFKVFEHSAWIFESAYNFFDDEIGDSLLLPDKTTGEVLDFIPDNHLYLVNKAMLAFANTIQEL